MHPLTLPLRLTNYRKNLSNSIEIMSNCVLRSKQHRKKNPMRQSLGFGRVYPLTATQSRLPPAQTHPLPSPRHSNATPSKSIHDAEPEDAMDNLVPAPSPKP